MIFHEMEPVANGICHVIFIIHLDRSKTPAKFKVSLCRNRQSPCGMSARAWLDPESASVQDALPILLLRRTHYFMQYWPSIAGCLPNVPHIFNWCEPAPLIRDRPLDQSQFTFTNAGCMSSVNLGVERVVSTVTNCSSYTL